MKQAPFLIGLWVVLCAFGAQAAYVSEDLSVPLRSGESTEYRILGYLKAGTEVTVLEALPSGYSRVVGANNQQGFVLTRYLVDTPPAVARLAALEAALEQERGRMTPLTAERDNALAEVQRLTDEVNRLAGRLASQQQALDALGQGEGLTFQDRLIRLELERQALMQDNQRLTAQNFGATDDSAKAWFGLGATTLGLGFLIGWILPRMRRNQVNRNL